MSDPEPTSGERAESTPTAQTPASQAVTPEIVQAVGQRMMPMFQSAAGLQVAIGPPPNAFIEKLQPEHITSVIANTAQDKKRDSFVFLIIVIASIAASLSLCWLFLAYEKDSVLEGIIKVFAGFIGGFGSGFAAAKWKSK